MQIPLKPGAVLDSKGRYRVSKRDEAAIDELFDKARADGRLSAAEGVVPVGWPVFVVWKNGKARPVVDLRGLNEQTVMDAYPLPRPDDITGRIKGKRKISLVDLQKSFYQFYLAYMDRWKTTMLTHRGQEWSNVAPTGACGSPSHVQRFMDKLLKIHELYAKSYIDDVIVYSDDHASHLQHLRAVLGEFSRVGLTLSPGKCFIGYHSLKVLGHVVDRFGLSTTEDKVAAISSMRFPEYLHELELFIGLSGYYRHFVARYAAIVEPLQALKTRLLKGAARKNKRQRSVYTRSTKLDTPSEAQLLSFNTIKDALCSKTVLIHHDHKLPLLIDVDSSVGGGYAAAIHQVPSATMEKEGLNTEDILHGRYNRKLEHPVTYISKQLNKHEVHYWPTELEIAGIVWTVQKLRHLIEGFAPTKIFTDHNAAADILSSRTLKTTSSVRMNLRLIRASQFISQYPNIRIVHRPGKDHVNADALSRLVQLRTKHENPREDEGGVYGFLTTTVVGVSMTTLRLLEEGYTKDRHLSLIYDAIRSKMKIKDDYAATELPKDAMIPYKEFQRIDKLTPDEIEYNGFQGRFLKGHILLYMTDPLDKHPRLCIPESCHQTFFEAAHDKNVHAGYQKAYSLLRQNYYMKNLSRALRSYIQSCPKCQLNNTLRHKPYGQLQPIESPHYPMQMVSIDLIVKLPETKVDTQMYDALMTTTDKLTKMVTLLLGREDWSAVQWADAFFKTYYRRWGIPQQIITDRGKVFLGEFWTALFKILRTDLLVTTAYHPQSDGQSERTNQIVEIALRHLVNNKKTDWATYLGTVEFTINNSAHSSTGVSPMKFLTGLDAPNTLATVATTALPSSTASDWVQTRNEIQDSARDALVFAQTKMAHYYDKRHKPLFLKPGDKAFVRLAGTMNVGYHLRNTTSHKLSQQLVGPFTHNLAISRLAYELEIPATWKIHPVISIAHLEPTKNDPYNRTEPPMPDIIADDSGEHEEWEAEEIVAERFNKRRKRREWLIKWKSFSPENNTWEPAEHLANAGELIDDFRAAKTPVIAGSTFFLPSHHPPPLANAFMISWS